MAEAAVSSDTTTAVKDEQLKDFEGDVKVTDQLPSKEDLDKCEDLVVLDSKGASRTFKSLYTADHIAPRQLIIFVRHFFCGVCQEFIRTLCSSITPDNLLALEKATFITIIGCGRPELIEMYKQSTESAFPIYSDPTYKLYENLGMVRTLNMGNKPEYMQSGMLGNSVRSIFQALKSGKGALNGGDMRQIGGEFLFEDGKLIWCHRMRNTRDHSEVTELRRLIGLDDAKPPLRKTWSSGIKAFSRRSSSWGRPAKEEKVKHRSNDNNSENGLVEAPIPSKENGQPFASTTAPKSEGNDTNSNAEPSKVEMEVPKESPHSNGTANEAPASLEKPGEGTTLPSAKAQK